MKNIITALIKELEQVYSKLVLNVLQLRSEKYRQQSQGQSSISQDIQAPLSDAISAISHHARKTTASTITGNPTNATGRQMAQQSSPSMANLGSHIEGGLSKYFKDTVKGTEAHPGIEERLVTSAWDHVHAAVRAARSADETTAQMHVMIASNACRELARYLSESSYRELITDIENHLNRMRQELN